MAMLKGGIIGIEVKTVTPKLSFSQFPEVKGSRYLSISVPIRAQAWTKQRAVVSLMPFFTTKSKGRDWPQDYPLSMAVIRSIMDFISVESTVGQGTTSTCIFQYRKRRKKSRCSKIR